MQKAKTLIVAISAAGVSSPVDMDKIKLALQGYNFGSGYISWAIKNYGNYSYDIIYNGPGKLGLPIKGMTRGNITSHFGPRSSPGGIGSSNHKGLDIRFTIGTKALACESGTVTTASLYIRYGKCIIIDHGKVGNTGNSTGPHLNLSVLVNGSYVNPEKGG